MRKADKLFQLTNLIRSRQPITAKQIAEELGVSTRTVYRYIDDLSVSGIPIYGIAGIGYQLHENYELPPLNLTEKELDALMLGIGMVNTWTGDELSEAARSLSHKVESVLPQLVRTAYSPTLQAPDLEIRDNERKRWQWFYKAIKQQLAVTIAYKALDGNKTSRTIYPLGLFYWGGKWTIGSWCTLRSSYRDFRLDRIESIRNSGEKFEETSRINLQSYLALADK